MASRNKRKSDSVSKTNNQLTQDLSRLVGLAVELGLDFHGRRYVSGKKLQKAVLSLLSNGNAVKTAVLDRFESMVFVSYDVEACGVFVVLVFFFSPDHVDNRIRHILMIDDKDVIGMVSIGDVVRAVVSEFREELDRLDAYIQ
ncbi:hypothetical protein Q3G72_002676 [Acer saccharum]|nr:hypothetical protein Q3G72_002676 [Acer saccharum]